MTEDNPFGLAPRDQREQSEAESRRRMENSILMLEDIQRRASRSDAHGLTGIVFEIGQLLQSAAGMSHRSYSDSVLQDPTQLQWMEEQTEKFKIWIDTGERPEGINE